MESGEHWDEGSPNSAALHPGYDFYSYSSLCLRLPPSIVARVYCVLLSIGREDKIIKTLLRIFTRLLQLSRSGWVRGRWRCVLAGTPLLLLALSAALIVAGFDGLPDRSRSTLGHLMRLEAYACFTGFLYIWFLMVGGVLAGGNRWGTHILPVAYWVILAGIVAFMTWIMWSTKPGIPTVLQYIAMVAVTYLGAFIDRSGPAAILSWLPRVIWSVIAFFVTMIVTDTPLSIDSWSTQQGVMWAALMYFSLLALMEFSGLYQLATKLADGEMNMSTHRDTVTANYLRRLREFAERQRSRERGQP